ncbi:MAG: DUF4230 domain-containing protein [Clostridium sp.]|uniref:DUF4230 domain-containing protein n=2 Tax=unclassified Clostridium TaxID=2614128 RepID=UPI002A82CFBD|nr:DUF4230 domain-containing protein [Clostridium sp.]MCI6691268.1 DUF4230 domain-containing protein [Clostridium sp.]MDY4252325.1 DUF4230 domain-containing protein [Clostridium sp.]
MGMEDEMVKEENKEEKKESKLFKIFKKSIKRKIAIFIVIIVLIVAVVIGLRSDIFFDSKTTKIGFENIGELATQTAYSTQLGVIDDSRELYGVTIPFTNSKYIYSCDVVIKAGFNFGDIEWEENNNVIEVKLPKAKILSSELDLNSFKIYHENESVFNQITITENNEAMKKLQKTAEENAVANGLLENARDNSETILKIFFSNKYDLEKYEIVFKDK